MENLGGKRKSRNSKILTVFEENSKETEFMAENQNGNGKSNKKVTNHKLLRWCFDAQWTILLEKWC
jgi:hypothetical protein